MSRKAITCKTNASASHIAFPNLSKLLATNEFKKRHCHPRGGKNENQLPYPCHVKKAVRFTSLIGPLLSATEYYAKFRCTSQLGMVVE